MVDMTRLLVYCGHPWILWKACLDVWCISYSVNTCDTLLVLRICVDAIALRWWGQAIETTLYTEPLYRLDDRAEEHIVSKRTSYNICNVTPGSWLLEEMFIADLFSKTFDTFL